MHIETAIEIAALQDWKSVRVVKLALMEDRITEGAVDEWKELHFLLTGETSAKESIEEIKVKLLEIV